MIVSQCFEAPFSQIRRMKKLPLPMLIWEGKHISLRSGIREERKNAIREQPVPVSSLRNTPARFCSYVQAYTAGSVGMQIKQGMRSAFYRIHPKDGSVRSGGNGVKYVSPFPTAQRGCRFWISNLPGSESRKGPDRPYASIAHSVRKHTLFSEG